MASKSKKKQGKYAQVPPQMLKNLLSSFESLPMSQCDCPILLIGLQCPFNWNHQPIAPDRCAYNKDKLFLAGTAFSAMYERLLLIYSLSIWDRRDEARALLVDCYMDLLPAFDTGCPLVRDYGPALRHVLDSTYAGLCVTAREQPCAGADPGLKDFIKRITRFEALGPRQQAAVHALEGRFGDDTDMMRMARKAMALSPDEGEWRYLLGWKLQMLRGSGPLCEDAEEVRLLRDADRMRRTPNTMLRLARTLADLGPAGRIEAAALLEEVQRMHPKNPAVFVQATTVLPFLRPDNPRLVAEQERLLLRAEALLPTERAHMHMKLATLYLGNNQLKKGKRHVERAHEIDSEAADVFWNDWTEQMEKASKTKSKSRKC